MYLSGDTSIALSGLSVRGWPTYCKRLDEPKRLTRISAVFEFYLSIA